MNDDIKEEREEGRLRYETRKLDDSILLGERDIDETHEEFMARRGPPTGLSD
jgi:hypothetical protein